MGSTMKFMDDLFWTKFLREYEQNFEDTLVGFKRNLQSYSEWIFGKFSRKNVNEFEKKNAGIS